MKTSQNIDLTPLEDSDWSDELRRMKGTFASKLNVYRTVAHHPRLLLAWADLRDHVVLNSALGRQQSEVVILRAGVHLGSNYEWCHHVSRARACGINDHRIASIRGSIQDMAVEDMTFAKAVDELFDQRKLTNDTIGIVMDLVGKEGVLDVIATVGFYSTLGYILNSFETPLDDNIAREMADQPLT
jgi:4-carboxymuconolactone decarboxylase